MKKIYMIWEENWGNTGIFFDDKNAALEYCRLRNDRYDNGCAPYSIIIMENYRDMEDFKSSNTKDMKWQLKDAISGLKKVIEKIKNNRHMFYVELKDGFKVGCTLERFEEILTEGKENKFKNKVFFASKLSYSEFESDESRSVKVEDLPCIEKGYKKAKQELKVKESRLKKYQKEYVELCGNKKVNKEEKELIK